MDGRCELPLIATLAYVEHNSHITSTISNRKGAQVAMSDKTTDKRLRYGFGEFNLGDAWRYYNVPLERARNAAQMFGQRHGMKFRVRQSAKAVLVERLA